MCHQMLVKLRMTTHVIPDHITIASVARPVPHMMVQIYYNIIKRKEWAPHIPQHMSDKSDDAPSAQLPWTGNIVSEHVQFQW